VSDFTHVCDWCFAVAKTRRSIIPSIHPHTQTQKHTPSLTTTTTTTTTTQQTHRYEVVDLTASLLRRDRPIHLLGIGGVRDIFHGVRQGESFVIYIYI
jgi:hypothetical protein